MAEKSKASQMIHNQIRKEKETEKGREVQKNKEKIQNNKEEQKKEYKPVHWLQINSKYMSICRYALFVIVASILIYILVSHWGETKAFISNLFGVLSPFFIGALAAYFLIPLVERIQDC